MDMDNSITPDEWVARQREDFRPLLQAARDEIKAAVPGVEEHMAYGMPNYRLGKVRLGAIGTAKAHCSLHGVTEPISEALGHELDGVEVVGKAAHFTPERPLPKGLAGKVMKLHLEGS